MSENFKLEIINPEKSFFSKEDVSECVVPAFEGEMGILKDHISIISFLKPGIIKVYSNNDQKNFYVEDGLLEFKENILSILTSSIFDLTDVNKKNIEENIKEAEKELQNEKIEDQKRFLLNQKIDVLKSISLN